ncbi:MAG: M1 family metallopeptidase [Longimicrobiales bacterium]
MRRCTQGIVLLALASASLTGCRRGANTPPPDRPEPQATRIGIVPPRGPYAPGIDALHYTVAITLPDTGTYIEATARADILMRERRDTVRLDLTGLRVLNVSTHARKDEPRPVSFRQDSAHIYVPAGNARVGDTLHITVVYNGSPDDGLILRKNVHGDWGAFADNWPDRARFWFPVIDHPSDKATVEFQVRAPAEWEVVANGVRGQLLQGAADVAQRRVWHWKIEQPIPSYLMVIGAANFTIGTVDRCARGGNVPPHPDGCVPVTYYAFPRDSANAARIFRRAGQMVAHFSELIAPFPYPALAHVQSATRFGGMENAGAIFYSERAIAGGTLGEGTVSHEVAHQWFGDGVTPGHWSDVWLSEGFATYFGNQFFEQADSVQRFRELTAQSWRGYLQGNDKDLAIVDTTRVPNNDLMALLNSNSYQKGGAVLHMLRGVLGDEVFFGGIRRYYRRHLNGNARTADLRRAVEEESGRDLGWFFDQWLYRPGYPMLEITHRWDATTSDAVVTVTQVQKPEWPVFRFPLDLSFRTLSGAEVEHRAQITERVSTIRVRLPVTSTQMRVDPHGWLLHEVTNR